MSKAKGLLERWVMQNNFAQYYELREETVTFLAQPEQEQEPVAWGYKKRVTYKPEGSEEEEIIPLYTAPPKREPLSEEESYHEAKRLYESEDGLWYQDGFIDGLKFAEKMHGIGGGE